MDKQSYLAELRAGLNFLPPDELNEIMDEFEEHFLAGLSQGKTEQELADQLGDPKRIIEGYRTDALDQGAPHVERAEPEPERREDAGERRRDDANERRRDGGARWEEDVYERTRDIYERTRDTIERTRDTFERTFDTLERAARPVSGFASQVNIHERYPAGEVLAIDIVAVDSDIEFELSDEGEVRVDIEGMSACDTGVELRNGKLRIEQQFRLFKLFHWRKEPEIRITLPRVFEGTMEVETASGDIKLPGFKGYALKLRTVSGDLKLGDLYLSNALALSTVSGDFRMGKSMAESIDVNTTSGDMKFDSLTTKTLRVGGVSGDVEQKHGSVLEAAQLRIKTVSGDISLAMNDHWKSMDFVTVSGDIDLTLPEDSQRFEVQLDSVSGKVKNQLGNDSYSGRLIKAKTVSGDLKIVKQ